MLIFNIINDNCIYSKLQKIARDFLQFAYYMPTIDESKGLNEHKN